MRGVTGITGRLSGTHYREMPPTCQQELEPICFKSHMRKTLLEHCREVHRTWQEKDHILRLYLGDCLSLEHVVDTLTQPFGSGLFVKQHLPFDKNCRRAADAYTTATLHVRHDALLNFRTVQIAREPLSIEPQLLSVLDKHWAGVIKILPRVLIPIETIVHLPELALVACGFGSTRRVHGVLVNLRQRKMM